MKKTVSLRLAAFAFGVTISGAGWAPLAVAQGASSQALYELMSRIGQLEREIRQLRGDMELYQYQQKELNRRLKGLESQMNAGATMQGGVSGGPEIGIQGSDAPPAAGGRPSSPAGSTGPGQTAHATPRQPAISPRATIGAPAPTNAEKLTYDAAFDSLRNGQYEKAIAGFQQFLADYPNSLLAANAHYWLGETYYIKREFPQAKEAFLALGAQYPKSDKLPEAMLKLGYIYEMLGEKEKARQVLQKLVQTYPNSRAASRAEIRLRAI